MHIIDWFKHPAFVTCFLAFVNVAIFVMFHLGRLYGHREARHQLLDVLNEADDLMEKLVEGEEKNSRGRVAQAFWMARRTRTAKDILAAMMRGWHFKINDTAS